MAAKKKPAEALVEEIPGMSPQEAQDKAFSFLAVFNIAANRVTQLSDDFVIGSSGTLRM